MKRYILSLLLATLLFSIPSVAFPSATVNISRADSIWQSIDQTPNIATSSMSATQMQMTRPLRYSVDTAIFKMKFSDTATVDTVNLVYITHKKKSVIKAARAALTQFTLRVRPNQQNQWVYHRMFCYHLRGQNDKWFEHELKHARKADLVPLDSTFGAPEMTKLVHPSYLSIAPGADTVRSVPIRVLIDERGQARLATVTRPSGISSLDDACIMAAMYNKFRPARIDGNSAPVWVVYGLRTTP